MWYSLKVYNLIVEASNCGRGIKFNTKRKVVGWGGVSCFMFVQAWNSCILNDLYSCFIWLFQCVCNLEVLADWRASSKSHSAPNSRRLSSSDQYKSAHWTHCPIQCNVTEGCHSLCSQYTYYFPHHMQNCSIFLRQFCICYIISHISSDLKDVVSKPVWAHRFPY